MANSGKWWRLGQWAPIGMLLVGVFLLSYGIFWYEPHTMPETTTSNPVRTDFFSDYPPSLRPKPTDHVAFDVEPIEPRQDFLVQVDDFDVCVLALFIKDGELQVEGNLSEGARLFFQMVKPYVDDHIARSQGWRLTVDMEKP